ncbi:MAG: hypothetical protein ACM3WP_01985 [Acidobacteriota bacterium]
MGVELVNRGFVRELFNIPERRATTPMTLAQHKDVYQELVTTNPRDGSMRAIAEYLNSDKQDMLFHYIQEERDIRRLALHRVEEAIDDLTKDELKKFVAYLIEQSKQRQAEDEAKLNARIGHARTLSQDQEWLRSLAQLNKLRMLFNDAMPDDGGCWFCENKPIPCFDKLVLKMWVIRGVKRFFGIPHK